MSVPGPSLPVVRLKPGRERSVENHHPWIFSGAIGERPEGVQAGATVAVHSAQDRMVGCGAFSSASQIAVRMWSFDADDAIDAAFFRRRLRDAVEGRRERLEGCGAPACRLVNAESDRLPGLIVDRYGDFLVCQFLSAGAEYWKETLLDLLEELVQPRGIYERSDVDVREKEGLAAVSGVLRGEEPPEPVEISVDELRFPVDVKTGHKTGFYLDQVDNLRVVAAHARDAEVLNCFSYTGAFGLAALKGGAQHIVNVESSASALRLAGCVAELNGFRKVSMDMRQGDVFEELRRFRDSRCSFDLAVLDPPKFAANASQVQRASRAYKDINLLAIKLLRANGVLVTFSCSGHVSPELFQKIVADAALDAGRDVQITGFLGQSADHPVATNFPQGRYLKGLLCRLV